MNKKKQVTFVLFLIIGFFLLFKYYETQSVLVVLNQRNDAVRNAKQRIHRNGEITEARFINAQRYVEELYKIDTSHCPKKFQLAWLDYVQACERAEKARGSIVVDFMYAYVKRSPFSLFKEIPKIKKIGDDEELAEQNLERVALEYDVRVIHKPS